ncbi:hypothetical protein LguiA_025625 [Lonicera macranthoides]
MTASRNELAKIISRAVLSASDQSLLPSSSSRRTWTPQLEQTLHRLGYRHSLNPTLVATVIDPFLLNQHSLAFGFFNWAAQQPGFSHTSLTYNSILKSLSLSRDFNAVHKLLHQVKAQNICLDPSIYSLLISSHIMAKKTQAAFSIFSGISSSIFHIGPETCNLLLAALSSDGYIGYARKLFDDMILRGVSLSTLGFGVFIWRFCTTSELGETLSLLDEVGKGDVSGINGSIIAVLVVHGLCLQSRVPEAIGVLDELRKRNFKPDFMAYRIVAEALRLMGGVVDVEKVLKKKRKLGVAPRANDYREFILSLITERLINEAKELGQVIVDGNFPIQDDVLNALIGSVSTINPSCALKFLNFMLGKESFPTLLTLSNLCRSLCKHGKIDEMVEVFKVLSAKGYFVDLECYNVMISFLCKAGRVKDAYQVLLDMKKKGLSPEVSSYNSLMEACCREDLLRPAKRLWDEMFASGCGGNLKTYNILICKFSVVGQAEEAHRLFSHMLEKGVAPDTTTYESLLGGLCQEKKLETALQVFKKSSGQDPMLAQSILSTFILNLCKEGHFVAASMLLPIEHINWVRDNSPHIILPKLPAEAGVIPRARIFLVWVQESLLFLLCPRSCKGSWGNKQELTHHGSCHKLTCGAFC